MRNTKKYLAVLTAGCMALGVLGSGFSAFAEESEVGGKLVIWEHTAQFEAPLKAVIEGFQEKYPDVEIEYQIKTSDQYYNLLQTAMQAGEAPDLFWTNGTATTNMQVYAEQGLLMDLTGKVDFSMYDGTSAMGICTVGDKIYATPTAEVGGRACFYNKAIFEELGLSVPTSFSEFEASLQTILDAGYVPIAFSGSDPWAALFHFEPLLAAMHLDWLDEYLEKGEVDVNDERVVEVYNKMLEWAEKGYYGVGYTGVDESGALLAFSKGEAAMCIEGTWNVQTIQENNPDLQLGAFQVPCEDGTRPFVGTSSCGFSVSENTENEAAALAFANYFASLDGQTRWISTLDAIPCTKEIVSENTVINEIADFDVQTESYYSILGYLEGEGESPRNVWEEDQCKIFTGGISVQDFVDELEALTR
ncbi:MAG: extracellular solute-binding protein [Candidatus Limivivens sp.]|nr:extracellular solute-binding protein [Candidatus Limivivens sp.]